MSVTHIDFLSIDSPGVLRFGGARMALLDIEAGFWGLRHQIETLVGQHLTDQVLQQAGANGGASFAASFIGEVSEAEGEQVLRDAITAYQAAGFGRFEVEAMEWPIGRIIIRGRDILEAWAAQKHDQVSERSVCAYSAGVLVGFVNVLGGRRDVVCIERTCQAQGAEACIFELLPAEDARDTPVVAIAPDPSLGHQFNLLELLFDRMPMGIAVFDRDYYLRRYNPTWADFAERYGPPSASRVVPGVFYFDLLPGSEPTVMPLFERVLAGETIRQEATRLESGGIVTYWDMVLAPLFSNSEVIGILNVTVDATERKKAEEALQSAYRTLKQRLADRTKELTALNTIAATVSRPLDLQEILRIALRKTLEVTKIEAGGVYLYQEVEERLTIAAHEGIGQKFVDEINNLKVGEGFSGIVFETCEPIIVKDLAEDPRLTREPVRDVGFKSLAVVPLVSRQKVLGTIFIIARDYRVFSPEDIDLLTSIGNQIGIAVEISRLYEQSQSAAVFEERQRLARELHDAVTQTLFAASLTAEALPRIWEKDPDTGRQRLDKLRNLTQGALAEMRTLLLELRPATLIETDMGDLLHQLAESTTGRVGVQFEVEMSGECHLRPENKIALYRIAQEALNNIAKHAEASHVTIGLFCEAEECRLVVGDDGRGFDPLQASHQKMGLGIMHERANAIGAEICIESQVGQGTQVSVVCHAVEGNEPS